MPIKKHLAHITTIDGQRVDQTIKEHSFQTAEYAGECLKSIGLYHAGYLAGLMHDCGKCKDEWDEYIETVYKEENSRIKVNHSFAAVKFLMERYYQNAQDFRYQLACEILAVAMGSHHGLFNLGDPTGITKEHGISHRVSCSTEEIRYTESINGFLDEVAGLEKIDACFENASKEIVEFIKKIEVHKKEYGRDGMFLLVGYLVRLIASAVIEGDRRDTAEFMDGKDFDFFHADDAFWRNQLKYMEEKLSQFGLDTPLNIVRSNISDQCKGFAKNKGGIYRLTVPTGGGKTLSSLRYALTHAERYKKDRIIYIVPLLSVLDQNSKDLHKYIKDKQVIFEHHSNVIKTLEDSEEMDKRELLTETWDAPVIVSTLVQLLNILFSHKTMAIRRMKSLCNSVLIIDEVQSLPLKFTELFTMAMNFLAECCGTTVVLCSATQPAFDKLTKPVHFAEEPEMVKLGKGSRDIFKRVEVIDKATDDPYGMSLDELANFAQENIENKDSLLIVCNTKSTARKLYQKLQLVKDNDCEIYHLSTSMCTKHREEILRTIGKTPGLNEPRKVICISTQLVEAGIDFSFECVIRIRAGVDSIAQAAGRCNRNNDWKRICQVFIVKLQNENLGPLEFIKQAQACCSDIAYEYREKENTDFLSEAFIDKYFQQLYSTIYAGKAFQYIVNDKKGKLSIRDMLSCNRNAECEEGYNLRQAFKTAGQNCKVFDDDKTDVIVRYDENAMKHILNLTSAKAQQDIKYLKEEIEQLKPYTVSLFEYEITQLRKDEMLDELSFSGAIILDKAAYNSDIGVSIGEYSVTDEFLIK